MTSSPLSRAEQARNALMANRNRCECGHLHMREPDGADGGCGTCACGSWAPLIPVGAIVLTAAEAEQVRDVCLRAILHTGPRARKREGSSIQPLRDDLRAMVALLSAGQPEQAGK